MIEQLRERFSPPTTFDGFIRSIGVMVILFLGGEVWYINQQQSILNERVSNESKRADALTTLVEARIVIDDTTIREYADTKNEVVHMVQDILRNERNINELEDIMRPLQADGTKGTRR